MTEAGPTKPKGFPSWLFLENMCLLLGAAAPGGTCRMDYGYLACKEVSSADLNFHQFVPKIIAELPCARHYFWSEKMLDVFNLGEHLYFQFGQ